jgi:hypothetical protein
MTRGRTSSTKDSGTSQTPFRTRTGASSITGEPFTLMLFQLRVSVMMRPCVIRRAFGRAAGASSRAFSSGASRASSTYFLPPWETVGNPAHAVLATKSKTTAARLARPMSGAILTTAGRRVYDSPLDREAI